MGGDQAQGCEVRTIANPSSPFPLQDSMQRTVSVARNLPNGSLIRCQLPGQAQDEISGSNFKVLSEGLPFCLVRLFACSDF